MISAVEEYKRENNPIISFIEDRCVIGRDEAVSKKEMYGEYKDYCEESGFKPLTIIKFGKELKRCLDSQVVDAKNGSGSEKTWSGITTRKGWETNSEVRPF